MHLNKLWYNHDKVGRIILNYEWFCCGVPLLPQIPHIPTQHEITLPPVSLKHDHFRSKLSVGGKS